MWEYGPSGQSDKGSVRVLSRGFLCSSGDVLLSVVDGDDVLCPLLDEDAHNVMGVPLIEGMDGDHEALVPNLGFQILSLAFRNVLMHEHAGNPSSADVQSCKA